MDPELWAELLRMSGGNPDLAVRMLLEVQDVRGEEDPAVIPGGLGTQPPIDLPRPPQGMGTQRPIAIPRPPRTPPDYDPLSSVGSTGRPGGGPSGGGGLPPGPFPPTEHDPNSGLGGPDMHMRFLENISNQLAPPPPPQPALPAINEGAIPAGRTSDEFVRPVPPTSPASVAPAQTPPVVSSRGDGGVGGEWMGPPMPRPNQPTMDGGLWAALRAAFAGNAGNNERLAIERMVASLGGGDRG